MTAEQIVQAIQHLVKNEFTVYIWEPFEAPYGVKLYRNLGDINIETRGATLGEALEKAMEEANLI